MNSLRGLSGRIVALLVAAMGVLLADVLVVVNHHDPVGDVSTLYAFATQVDTAHGSAAVFAPGRTGDRLKTGDVLRTNVTGRAELDWADGSLTRLGPSTTLQVMRLAKAQGRKARTRLDIGQTWNRVQRVTGSGGYEVATPVGVAAVHGTRFAVVCSAGRVCAVSVVEGVVLVTATSGAHASVLAGQSVLVHLGDRVLRPRTLGAAALAKDAFIAENLRLDQLPRDQRSQALAALPAPTARPTASPKPRPSPTPRRTTAAPTPKPVRSSIPSMIVFNKQGNIYALGANGRIRQLTSTGTDSQAAVSPDGKRIAFERDPGGVQQMWVMAADGSGAHRIGGATQPAPYMQGPYAWSPDGRYLAGRGEHSGDNLDIIDVASGATHTVPHGAMSVNGVTWSPDGRQLAFIGYTGTGGSSQLVAVRVDGSGWRLVPAKNGYLGGAYPAWRPGGLEVAFNGVAESSSGMAVVRADGRSAPQPFAADRSGCRFSAWNWTADGRELIADGHCQSDPASAEGVWSINRSTGHAVRLALIDTSGARTASNLYPSVSGSGPFAPVP